MPADGPISFLKPDYRCGTENMQFGLVAVIRCALPERPVMGISPDYWPRA